MLSLRYTGYHCWQCFKFISDLHEKRTLTFEDGSVAPFCGSGCLTVFCAENGMRVQG